MASSHAVSGRAIIKKRWEVGSGRGGLTNVIPSFERIVASVLGAAPPLGTFSAVRDHDAP